MTTVHRDIPYTTSSPTAAPLSQTFDLYLPSPSPPSTFPSPPPLLVYIHGGLWMDRDKSDYSSLALHFSSLGLPTAVLNYRLTSHTDDPTIVHHPAHTQDVARAVRFLSAPFSSSTPPFLRDVSLPSPPYDPTRLVLFGHSCGAHMAALLPSPAFAPFPSAVLACIGLQGLYCVASYAAAHPEWSADLFRVFPRWDDPTDHPAGKVPAWLVLHSTGDQWVEQAQPEAWVKHLTQAHATVQYELINDGGAHWEVVDRIGKDGDSVTARVVRFVQALL